MSIEGLLRRARRCSGLTLRSLAEYASTSHATLSAYEHGRTTPSVATLARIVRAAGFDIEVTLVPAVGGPDGAARGRELEEVLALTEEFPARHARMLSAPVFGRA